MRADGEAAAAMAVRIFRKVVGWFSAHQAVIRKKLMSVVKPSPGRAGPAEAGRGRV